MTGLIFKAHAAFGLGRGVGGWGGGWGWGGGGGGGGGWEVGGVNLPSHLMAFLNIYVIDIFTTY